MTVKEAIAAVVEGRAEGRIVRRPRPPKTKYRTRPRAFDYMGWVKQQPCIVRTLAEIEAAETGRGGDLIIALSNCGGVVEADHTVNGGMSHKGPDALCVPICTQHHRERTDFSGAFKFFTKATMRAFTSTAVQLTQNRARAAGVEIPEC